MPEALRDRARVAAAGADLEQAVAALSQTGSGTLFLRSGLFRLQQPLRLTAAANGLRLTACPGATPVIMAPPDGPAMILDGSHGIQIDGLAFTGAAVAALQLRGAAGNLVAGNLFLPGQAGILLDHAAGNRVGRNLVLDMAGSGIELKDASNANVVADNVIDGVAAPETSGGGIFLHGVHDNRIGHNLVQNTAGFGIGVSNWDDATINTGNVVEYNLLRRTAQTAQDSGAIYVLGRSGVHTDTVIAGNVIDGVGGPDRHSVGIYLDDSTSGAIVASNLLRGIGSDAMEIHGGRDNLVQGNLIDLGSGRPAAVLFQAAPADTHPPHPQGGNAVMRNVILSANPEPRFFAWYDGGSPQVSGNIYLTSRDVAPPPNGPASDLAPMPGDPATAASAMRQRYVAAQAAAAAAGFKPIDPAAAGVRPQRP